MRILVDTNPLVRSVERMHPLRRVARTALMRLYSQGHELCVTPQNISEFWNVCTLPVEKNGLGNTIATTDRLTSRVETFFTILPDSIETFRHWRRLVVTHEVKGAKVHDAKLVATMLVYQISHIVTFNADDFARFPAITVLDPAKVS
jgi:predicted nucleic acid-binding protein